MSTEKDKNQVSLDDKLFTVRRKSLKASHIRLDGRLCKDCLRRICTYVCPAEVYVWNGAESRIDIRYENCLECGACRVACDGIEWSNPMWGAGISYKNS